jgi:hypothetical protein
MRRSRICPAHLLLVDVDQGLKLAQMMGVA